MSSSSELPPPTTLDLRVPASDALNAPDPWLMRREVERFRQETAKYILRGVFWLTAILLGGSTIILIWGMASPNENRESLVTGAQAVLTSAIGFMGGAVTSVLGYYFQAEKENS